MKCHNTLCKVRKSLVYAHGGYFCPGHRVTLQLIRADLHAVKSTPFDFRRLVSELYLRYEEMQFRGNIDDVHVRVITNFENALRDLGYDPGVIMSIVLEHGRVKRENAPCNRNGTQFCAAKGCRKHKCLDENGYCKTHTNVPRVQHLRKLGTWEVIDLCMEKITA